MKELSERAIQLGLNADKVLDWNYNGWKEHTDSPLSQKDWNSTLVTMFNMANKELDGKGDCLIVSLEGGAILDDNPLFFISDDNSLDGDSFYKMGIIGNYKIYLDKTLNAGSIVVVNEEEFLDLSSKPKSVLISIRGLQIIA